MTPAITRKLVVWLTTMILAFGLPFAAQAGEEEAVESGDQRVERELDQKLAQRREGLLRDARVALDDTHAALMALDDGKADEALDALAHAAGKLELVVTRDPQLALAPVGVDVITHDLYASPESIVRAREEAQEMLEDGRVQEARKLLSGLASEVVFRVTNLPLATYPEAIKAVSPRIDAGELEEARAALRAALATLVVVDRVVPLPVLRARAMLEEAEQLARSESVEEGEEPAPTARVPDLLHDAREQLRMAELLGYGKGEDLAGLREQISALARKVGEEEDTGGLFAKIRSSLSRLQGSSAD